MHAFLIKSAQNPRELPIQNIIPQKFTHTFFYEIKTIDEVRALKKSFLFSPHEKTIVVISGLDYAKHEAQNALLKLLEEPPHENIIFLLVVQNIDAIVQTIISRLTIIKNENARPQENEPEKLSFLSISKITDRDEAIKMLENYHSEAALLSLSALKKNGNVALWLTQYLLSDLP